MSDNTFDFVIAGAGSAGCVLANRLSAAGKYRVALVEAGSNDNWIWFHIPIGYLFAIGNARADWLFSTEPESGLNGRSLAYPRGKVIGGSSAINAMIYMRGQARDYDGWRQMGLEGWGWEDVLPVFKRHEDHFLGASAFHGSGGEWRVDRPRKKWPLLDSVIEAAEQCGIPRSADFNTGDNEGCGYFQLNQKHGRRWSAARGFLKPVLGRPNLTLITGALVDRVMLSGRRATGLAIREKGKERLLQARGEVILAAGAVGSPVVLTRSGIGEARHLQDLGIDVVHHSPGVGANLQDHLQLRPVFTVSGAATLNTQYRSLARRAWMGLEYALLRKGPLTMAPSQLGAFTRSSPEYDTPNLQFHVQPLSLDKFGDALHPFDAFTISVCNLRPSSRGTVRLRSRDPDEKPIIAPNYLSTEEDRRVAADAIRWARKLAAAPALARYSPEEYRPGAHLTKEQELVEAAGAIGTTIFHPVGTARMGAESDPFAVTDARLRVMGIERLRVVDASVMPTITSGNTNSPTIMIADKGAEMVLQDA